MREASEIHTRSFIKSYVTVVANTHLAMHDNDLFKIFPEFSKVVHNRAVIPATSCSAERSFSGLRRLTTIGWQQLVSNIPLINIERAYANSVVNNDIDHIGHPFV